MSSKIARATPYRNTYWWLPGGVALLALMLLVVLPLWALIGQVSDIPFATTLQTPYVRHVIHFSLWQASLSTLLSVGLAIPLAVALARQAHFPGRRALLRLFSVSFILPSIVAVYGIIAVFGQRGWFSQGLAWLGATDGWPSLYGLDGILLAHVFFNLPLSTRILLQSIETIPPEQWRLASQLGMRAGNSLRLVQWPVIKAALPGLALLVFALCFTSFTVVMALGGGPRATTIEVAIYQALRFDFALDTAAALAIVQLLLCGGLFLLTTRFSQTPDLTASRGMRFTRHDGAPRLIKTLDFSLIGTAAALVCLPLLAVAAAGLSPVLPDVVFDRHFGLAAVATLAISLGAGLLCVALAYALLLSSVHLRVRTHHSRSGKLLALGGSLILVVPPLVLGTGLFLLLRRYTDVFALAVPLTLLVNALMGLPFAIRILEGPMLAHARLHDRNCAALGIQGLQRWRWIDWPTLRPAVGLALAVCATLAAGDLTVIALFGSQDIRTLPLLLYQRMGAYQMQEAAVTALLLLAYCLVLFTTLESLVGRPRGARYADT